MASLTPDELAAIAAAHDKATSAVAHGGTLAIVAPQIHAHRAALLAHIAALTARHEIQLAAATMGGVVATRRELAKICDAFVRERSAQVASPELAGDSHDDAQRREWVRCKLSEAVRCRDAILRWTP